MEFIVLDGHLQTGCDLQGGSEEGTGAEGGGCGPGLGVRRDGRGVGNSGSSLGCAAGQEVSGEALIEDREYKDEMYVDRFIS
jgi:hypothetical protein